MGASEKFQGCFKSLFIQMSRVPRIFHRSFKEISRKVLKCLVECKALVSVFQCCYVFESLSLHITHRSYPSRRRACLLLNFRRAIKPQMEDDLRQKLFDGRRLLYGRSLQTNKDLQSNKTNKSPHLIFFLAIKQRETNYN